MRRTAVWTALLPALVLYGCGGGSGTGGPSPVSISSGPAVLVGAGDIGWCESPAPEATARLLDRIEGTVFAAGDIAYPDGTRENFRDCYDPSWGRHRARTRPVPGNHEYQQAGAAPYFEYFGANAGPAGFGYYSFDLGAWHIVALNSNIPIGQASPQLFWLRQDLEQHQTDCTLAYWHHPLFSSGPIGDQPFVRDVWRVLYEHNAEVVLNGHEHMYERYAQQDPNGRFDLQRGIREFVVGTGGAPLYQLVRSGPNLETSASVYGVLRLTLSSNGYTWEFMPVAGESYRDSGTGTCH